MFFKRYKNLRKFKKYFLTYKNTIKILIIVMFLASSLGMLLPYLISKRIIGITNINSNIVLSYSVLIILTILFHHIFWYLWEKIGSILTNKVSIDIRKDITRKFIDTKYLYIKNKTSGYYLERINDDVLEVSSFLSNVLGTLVDTLTNFSFLVLIYFLNYKCGILFTVGIVYLYIIDLIKIKKDMKYTEIIKQLNEKFNSKVNENIKGIKDIKALGIKNIACNDTNIISEELSNIQIKKDSSYALFSRIKTFSQYFIETLLIIYSVLYLIPNNEMTVVILLTITNYIGFMYDLVGYFAKMKDYFIKGDYKAARILEIIDNDNLEKFGLKNNIKGESSIIIKDLSYSYEEDNMVLKDINLSIKSNSATVIIGNSGSGKSTLFSLISKLLNTNNNSIFINGNDINSLSEKCLRSNMCIINQEPFLLNDSIINNIKIVKPTSTLEEIYKACKKANIHNEIKAFKNGYDTIINENGSNLSGGQKQRIMIARAILKDNKILLFDEPTSSLDKENQELFLKTIKTLKKKKIILVIAHKLSSYDEFDNIYEIKNGNMLKIHNETMK